MRALSTRSPERHHGPPLPHLATTDGTDLMLHPSWLAMVAPEDYGTRVSTLDGCVFRCEEPAEVVFAEIREACDGQVPWAD